MTKTNNKQIKGAYRQYRESGLYTLYDCYNNFSYYKMKAFKYCRELIKQYNGYQGRIISYNIFSFTYGFIGEVEGKKAFIYITKDYDRFIYLDDIKDL